jgi:hypothetical protein
MSVRYVPKRGSLTPILKGDQMREALVAAAQPILDRAKSGAPVDTGALRESMKAVPDLHDTRWAVHVGTHVPYGGILEARRHMLRRALG